MSFEDREEKFLKEYEKLCKKYRIFITGLGPFLVDAEEWDWEQPIDSQIEEHIYDLGVYNE